MTATTVAEREGRKGVEAVDRAFRILKAFDISDRPLTLSTLCERTGLHKSTVLRLTVSLERDELLVRLPDKRFRLGPAVVRLAQVFDAMVALPLIAREPGRRLMEATGLSVTIFVAEGDTRVCVFRLDPPESLRDAIDVSDVRPLDDSAVGQTLRQYATGRPASAIAPIHELDRTGSDLATAALPLFGTDGELLGAIAVSGSAARFSLLGGIESSLLAAAVSIEAEVSRRAS